MDKMPCRITDGKPERPDLDDWLAEVVDEKLTEDAMDIQASIQEEKRMILWRGKDAEKKRDTVNVALAADLREQQLYNLLFVNPERAGELLALILEDQLDAELDGA